MLTVVRGWQKFDRGSRDEKPRLVWPVKKKAVPAKLRGYLERDAVTNEPQLAHFEIGSCTTFKSSHSSNTAVPKRSTVSSYYTAQFNYGARSSPDIVFVGLLIRGLFLSPTGCAGCPGSTDTTVPTDVWARNRAQSTDEDDNIASMVLHIQDI